MDVTVGLLSNNLSVGGGRWGGRQTRNSGVILLFSSSLGLAKEDLTFRSLSDLAKVYWVFDPC